MKHLLFLTLVTGLCPKSIWSLDKRREVTGKRLSSPVSTKKSHGKCSVKDAKVGRGFRDTRDEAGSHLSVTSG